MPKSKTWKEFKAGDNGKAPEKKYHARVSGRFILYSPSFFPTPEVKEWGARWDGKEKAWRLPRLARMARKIHEYDPEARMTQDVEKLLNEWDIPYTRAAEMLQELYGEHPSFDNLYPYQVQAVCALVKRMYHGKMCIMSPGLGKTPTSIIAADLYARATNSRHPRFLVVCPKALVFNWIREIDRWSEHKEAQLVRTLNREDVGVATWSVVNPEAIFERKRATDGAPLRITGQLDPNFDKDWDVLILDESVLYKNRKSKRSSVMKSLAHKASQVWMLSGAPITHDNSDIWQQLNIGEPDYFSSFWRFAHEFCVVEQTPWSMGVVVGSRRDMELRAEFPDMLFVRNQEEVFDDLPQVVFQDLELPLTRRQKKAHDDLMDIWMHELEANRDSYVEVTAVIAQLLRLQQVTSNLKNLETTGKRWPDDSSKADAVMELIGTGAVEGPVLIWTHHRPGGQALYDRIDAAIKKRGSDLKGKRVELVQGGTKKADSIIEDFKAGEVDYLILSIGVGKYGHTLANVRTVIYFDKTWDSDAWFQSLHRYAGARGKLAGYDHNPVVITLRCRGTVDDFVEMNLAGKLPDMAKVTGADLLKILRSLGANYIEDMESA